MGPSIPALVASGADTRLGRRCRYGERVDRKRMSGRGQPFLFRWQLCAVENRHAGTNINLAAHKVGFRSGVMAGSRVKRYYWKSLRWHESCSDRGQANGAL